MNLKTLNYQVKEFYYFTKQKKIYGSNNIDLIKPFYDFLEYNEKIIIETLKKLKWQKASISGNSYWRADCDMNAVRQYFHNKISGYNEQEYYYGQMLNENLITKEYYDKNVQGFDQTNGIIQILESSGISEKSIMKYRKFLNIK